MNQDIFLLILSSLISIISGYALLYVNPRSRIVYWLSHYSDFIVPIPQEAQVNNMPSVVLTTSSIIVRNNGSRSSQNVEIVHREAPYLFKIFPPLDYEASFLPSGQHVIKITRLAAKEVFSLHCLWMQINPVLIYVRSENGVAKQENIISQPARSRTYRFIMLVVTLIGVFASTYWLGRAIMFILHNI